jgi:molecular chaperone GrpE
MADDKNRPAGRSAGPADDPAEDRIEGAGNAPATGSEAPDMPGGGQGGGDPAETLAARLEGAEQQLEQYRDQALRAQAEAENTRRRASRDVENAHKYALEKFTADLLPVLDSLEKAVEVASGSTGAESIGEGVQLSLKLFLSVLEKHGVQQIDPLGEPFDPQLHEAMTMVPSAHAEPNSVLEVMQRGYVLNGRLVRAAKVVVARAPDPAASGNGA